MENKVSKETLMEFGFKVVDAKTKDRQSVFTKDNVEIVIVDDGTVMYSNMGFDYLIADLPALKKLYKELRRTELVK